MLDCSRDRRRAGCGFDANRRRGEVHSVNHCLERKSQPIYGHWRGGTPSYASRCSPGSSAKRPSHRPRACRRQASCWIAAGARRLRRTPMPMVGQFIPVLYRSPHWRFRGPQYHHSDTDAFAPHPVHNRILIHCDTLAGSDRCHFWRGGRHPQPNEPSCTGMNMYMRPPIRLSASPKTSENHIGPLLDSGRLPRSVNGPDDPEI